ncbi:hypothetical protein NDU88_005421 [Pleurodeles waltl]|uniref:Uncharacterized protein n=1 Tax=Pleurodeles waltl TaxID=8319 RepID=A0AAV7TTZ0_PLEWA|nr:hypothetical protein NDU88_005421 [Pleurodeles waltl]
MEITGPTEPLTPIGRTPGRKAFQQHRLNRPCPTQPRGHSCWNNGKMMKVEHAPLLRVSAPNLGDLMALGPLQGTSIQPYGLGRTPALCGPRPCPPQIGPRVRASGSKLH